MNNSKDFPETLEYKKQILSQIVDLMFYSSLVISLFLFYIGDDFAIHDSIVAVIVIGIIKISFSKEHYLIASSLLMLSLLFMDNALLLLGDGIHDVTAMFIPVTIIIAGLLLENTLYWLYTSLLVFTVTLQGMLELAGILTYHVSPYIWHYDITILTAFLIILTFIVRYFTNGIYTALRKAHRNGRNYETIFQSAADGILIIDPSNGEIIDANETVLQIFDCNGLGTPSFDMSRLYSNEEEYSRESFHEKLKKTEEEGPQLFKWLTGKYDNSPLWLEMSLKKALINEEERIISIIRNINNLVELEEELVQSEKLKAVGQLAGGIAHDFNNQLMVISGLVEVIDNETTDLLHKKYFRMIRSSLTRSTKLIDKMLCFARKGINRKEPVVLQEIVKETVFMLERSINKRVLLKMDLAESPLLVRGDESQLQNVLLNVGINAYDAISGKGEILYSCYPQKEEDGKVCLIVKDTGCGMSRETMGMIFNPFFTTKKENSGTGLGLSAAYGTIKDHNGEISVLSEPGRGSEFRISLPLSPA